MHVAGFLFTQDLFVLALTRGLVYGLLAVGLVLVYRSTRIVNFAHGEVGALGAAVLGRLVLDEHWSFWLALPVVVAGGAALSALVEVTVVQRLASSPRVVLLVATIGVSEVLLLAQLLLPTGHAGVPFPTPLHVKIHVGNTQLSSRDILPLVAVPLAVAGLTLFLQRTRTGLAMRAAAENPDAAELAGISSRRVSTIAWALAGGTAVVTTVLLLPLNGVPFATPDQALGPSLLLKALAAALIGRLVSLPLALVGGLVVGFAETTVLSGPTFQGGVEIVLFVLVVGSVLVQAVRRRTVDPGVSLQLGAEPIEIPANLAHLRWVRLLPTFGWAALALAALLVPLLTSSPGTLFLLTRMLLLAIVGLSLVVLTGWAGEISLGQLAFYGLGAAWVSLLEARGVGFWPALVEAVLVGVLAAMLVGAPALVVRGLFLAVTTLAFSILVTGYVLRLSIFTDAARVHTIVRPAGVTGNRAYYLLCLAVLALACLLVGSLRRTGIARTIIAVRSNPFRAAALTVDPVVGRLTAFALAGALAALAGGLFGGLKGQVDFRDFDVYSSLTVVSLVMIGGVGRPSGAVLGALWVVGLPALFGDSDTVKLASSGIGLLVLLLYVPGGLSSLVVRARNLLLTRLSAARPPVQAPRRPALTAVAGPRPLSPKAVLDVAVAAVGVRVAFGGRIALDEVSLAARPGEVLGLIGANGAGKSTLLNVLSGFVTPGAGTVVLAGYDVTALRPHERSRLGLGRVFQDARLFADLTVHETIQVALEARGRSVLLPAAFHLPPSVNLERQRRAAADDLVSLLGLGRYARTAVTQLSTGTRRVVELACLVAQDASVLLLDEPTAGLAQRETEAFGPLLLDLRAQLDATLVVIEHDLPLVLGISDRVQVLGAGVTIALGTPAEVRNDPAVIAAYLGTDERAIARSGPL